MTGIEIALFGRPSLWHPDHGPIELASHKGAQLLALLAYVPGKLHRREVLQVLLWPDSDTPHAQGNLRFILHQLRILPRQSLIAGWLCAGFQPAGPRRGRRSVGGKELSATRSRRSRSIRWIHKVIGCSACCFRCGAISPEPAFTLIAL